MSSNKFTFCIQTIQLRKCKSTLIKRLANLEANNRQEDGMVDLYFTNVENTNLAYEEQKFQIQQNAIRELVMQHIEQEINVQNINGLKIECETGLVSSNILDIRQQNSSSTRRKKLNKACQRSFDFNTRVARLLWCSNACANNKSKLLSERQMKVLEDVIANPHEYVTSTITVEIELSPFKHEKLAELIQSVLFDNKKLHTEIAKIVSGLDTPAMIVLYDTLKHATLIEYNPGAVYGAKAFAELQEALQNYDTDTPRKLLTHLFCSQDGFLLNDAEMTENQKSQYALSVQQLNDIQDKGLVRLVVDESKSPYVYRYSKNHMEYHFKIVWGDTTLAQFNQYCVSLSEVAQSVWEDTNFEHLSEYSHLLSEISPALQSLRQLCVRDEQLHDVNAVLTIRMNVLHQVKMQLVNTSLNIKHEHLFVDRCKRFYG